MLGGPNDMPMTSLEIADVIHGAAMKATIDVSNREEADRIKAALGDATVRAFVTIVGALNPFPRRTRERLLTQVQEHFQELDNGTEP
jgi:hypothetical protein